MMRYKSSDIANNYRINRSTRNNYNIRYIRSLLVIDLISAYDI